MVRDFAILLMVICCPLLVRSDCPLPTIKNFDKEIENRTLYSVPMTKPMILTCSGVDQGDYTLQCGDTRGESVTKSNSVKLSYIPSKESHTKKCTCTVEKDQCGPQTSYFTLLVYHGPTKVTAGPKNGEHAFALCPKKSGRPALPTDKMLVYCEVKKEDVYPEPSVKLRLLDNTELNPTSSVHDNDVKLTYYFSMEKGTPRMIDVKCVAKNPKLPWFKAAEEKLIVWITKPPSLPPSIIIDGKNIDDGDFELESKEKYVMECHVPRGSPTVIDVTLDCGKSGKKTTKGQSSAITIHKSLVSKKLECKCTANHISKCYLKYSSFSINFPHSASTVLKLSALVLAMGALVAFWRPL